MIAAQTYQAYESMNVRTADRGELVVMLYQGAIKFLGRAAQAIEDGQIQEAHNNIVRGQDILAELMGSLNLETGELAYNLFRIYEFMHYRLVQANLRKDVEPVNDVLQLLRDLLPAWQQVARDARKSGSDVPVVSGRRLSLALA